jgi:predicted RNase H-like nuclease (RuvC/YqgF family)
MNKKLVEFMIQDLKQSDVDKVVFNNSIQSRDSIIESYHNRLMTYEDKVDDLNKRLVTYRTLSEQQSIELDGKDSRIQELTKQLRIVKRQRNWSMVAGVLGVAGVHLGWKYINWRSRYGNKN